MHRGVEVDLHLNPTLTNEMAVAEALGNLAAFALARERHENLRWQVLHISGQGPHHFRLIVSHPDRLLDVGFVTALRRTLDGLSADTEAELQLAVKAATREGLAVVPIRTVHETVDYWRDDFWNWFG